MKPACTEFSHPRLIALYDTLNALGADRDFFCAQAETLSAHSIIDLGCGTGLLTCELAKRGHQMIGIDPSGAMLAVARSKPYAEQVTWIEGGYEQFQSLQADMILMTSHVAQFFLADEEWRAMLEAAYRALVPGGHIVFDSRNPLTKPWEKWIRETSSKQVVTPEGQVEMWYRLGEVNGNRVLYEIHYLFIDSREELVSRNELIYRSQSEISQSLLDAGFSVENVYGDWDSSPATAASREMLYVARRN